MENKPPRFILWVTVFSLDVDGGAVGNSRQEMASDVHSNPKCLKVRNVCIKAKGRFCCDLVAQVAYVCNRCKCY